MGHQSGTTKGYRPQYREIKTGEWKNIDYKIGHLPRGSEAAGIAFPIVDGGVLETAWLLGKAQANAVAWIFAADWAAMNFREIEVRVVEYEVKYSIEYSRVPDPKIEVE